MDDSLDVFAVHGIGGMLGGCWRLLSWLCLRSKAWASPEDMTVASHLGVQLTGVVAVAAWSLMLTVILAKITQAVVGLRASKEEEFEGLDITAHGERAYDL